MKKKIGAVLFVLLVMVVGMRSCGSADGPKKGKADGLVVLAADLKEKKITEEEAFVYRVQSVFNSPDTPKKYRTFERNDLGTHLMKVIKLNWDSFSDKAKKQLEPYYVSPLDKKSFINNPTYEEDTDFLVQEVYAEEEIRHQPTITRKFFITRNGKVKIWYLPHEKQYAKTILEAFDTDNIYERETGFMGFSPPPENEISDEKLDIFFYRNVSWWGVCVPSGPELPGHKYASWIGINRDFKQYYPNKHKAYMKSTLVHELFHSIQYAIDMGNESWWWWQEATAVWAESYIYPSVNFEHRFKNGLFRDFWMTRRLSLYDSEVLPAHEYYAYIFPLYLAQKDGPYIIRNLWKASEPVHKQVLDVMDEQTLRPFKEVFTEFAVWMFNEKPEKHFLEGSAPLTNVKPSKEVIPVRVGKNKKRRFEVQHLGILFEEYKFNDSSVKSVDFDLSSLLGQYPEVGVWAMIKVKGEEMYSEDWSGVTFRNFCFDLPEEKLERVVLVYANSSRHTDIPAAQIMADVTGYADGCAAKLSLSWSLGSSSDAAPTQNKYGLFMGGNSKRQETGQLNVIFREVWKEPGFPEMGKILIPYGSFSFNASENNNAKGGVKGMFQFGGNGALNGSAVDSWQGNNLSKNEYGHIELKVYWPGDTAERAQEEQMAASMASSIPGIGGLFGQAQSVRSDVEAMNIDPSFLKTGEMSFELTLEVNDIPARLVSSVGTEETTMDMSSPIEIYKVFKATDASVPVNKTGSFEGASLNVSGTLRINQALRSRTSGEWD